MIREIGTDNFDSIEKSATWSGFLGRSTPHLGVGFTALGVANTAHNIHTSNYEPKVITQEVGGWGTAYAGAKLGIYWGGLIGNIPGAFFGGIIGGLAGYWIGYDALGTIYDWID